MIIDVHTHFYPGRLLEQFDSLGKYGFEVQRDASGNRVLYRHGKLVATYTDAFCSIDKRLEEMAKGKVDLQALSVVQPGVAWAEPELGLNLCQIINDEIYQIVRKYPGHFVGIASVPLQDVDRAIQELDRAVNDLDCKGVAMGTNINGMDLDDPQLFPFYQNLKAISSMYSMMLILTALRKFKRETKISVPNCTFYHAVWRVLVVQLLLISTMICIPVRFMI